MDRTTRGRKKKKQKGKEKGNVKRTWRCVSVYTYIHTYTSYYFIQEFGYFRGFLLYCCHFPIVLLVFIWRARLGSGDKAGGEEMGCKRWSQGLDFHLRC
ncbi:hypothetical protein NEUTE1DRAFT_117139 [Neurospora tetrasperma FGSC 2508]|uniref:Uncharacterized protein n=1 Tax=Neurospora tetrasperma (strain FGSC 2508 / ATCC MYA-4615 / P0657) TaxID=510951 RepID=F8MKZ0_NEUT8|nr:uncharacterized protein NEUTE1DRAFT_117139 [Neurospora tetrasperma FGSC 2508]EGO58315.1 hypothetical protein NEUTE1DRAFT_117139 [Neurospora tetrasperma FGSC 2508]EGZ71367.1 hypothetical protein NEUTE2DRAFT_144468 [Neurospora tetrasperma FGSC 2509]